MKGFYQVYEVKAKGKKLGRPRANTSILEAKKLKGEGLFIECYRKTSWSEQSISIRSIAIAFIKPL